MVAVNIVMSYHYGDTLLLRHVEMAQNEFIIFCLVGRRSCSHSRPLRLENIKVSHAGPTPDSNNTL